uniref:Histone-lysine N-methyltransferase, H3 lysine-79 specific n=1 Tax=Eutreptiella gymnastica TaxID=73025 RepID=A0A7S4GF40_9EUGL
MPEECLPEVLEYDGFAPEKFESIQRALQRKRHTTDVKDLYWSITSDAPLHLGKAISKNFRDSHDTGQSGLQDTDLVYGEGPYESFLVILQKIADCEGGETALKGVFYDLGSGTGKLVVAAALLGNFERVCGIEFVDELHEAAQRVKVAWEQNTEAQALKPNLQMQFVQSDLQQADWSDGTVCFANCMCFSPELLEGMGTQADAMASGTFFITSGLPLINTKFEVVSEAMLEHPYYIHRKQD